MHFLASPPGFLAIERSHDAERDRTKTQISAKVLSAGVFLLECTFGWASTQVVKVHDPDWAYLVRHLVEGRDGQWCVGRQVVQGVDTQPNHGTQYHEILKVERDARSDVPLRQL